MEDSNVTETKCLVKLREGERREEQEFVTLQINPVGLGDGQLAVSQQGCAQRSVYQLQRSCLRRFCLLPACTQDTARVSHLATGWHFGTRNPASLRPGKPLGASCLEKGIGPKASDGKPPGKGWCRLVPSK